MISTSHPVTKEFATRNCIFLSFLYLAAVCDSLFLVFAQILYKSQHNRVNSLFGLCFIFTPMFLLIVCTVAIIMERVMDVTRYEENPRKFLTFAYAINLISALLKLAIICNFVGTTKRRDSAYDGLINRYLC